jgi:hypothetical protein
LALLPFDGSGSKRSLNRVKSQPLHGRHVQEQ